MQLLGYYLVTASMRKYLLLVLSLAFYAQFGLRNLTFLLALSLGGLCIRAFYGE